MKGTIVRCLQELVENRYGKAEWQDVLRQAGFEGPQLFALTADVEDSRALALFEATGRVLELAPQAVADAFGDHWVNEYAARIYRTLYARLESARAFILAMDDVHQMVTNTIENAHPPRFEYELRGEKKILVTYRSRRNLIDLYVGLARGVGRYFGTPLEVVRLSSDRVEITFP